MRPLRTATILLSLCVMSGPGCTWLPSRGVDGADVELELEPANLIESGAGPSPGPPSRPALEPRPPVGPALGTAGTRPASSGQPVAQAGFETVAPVAEMSAFIQELEAASHIDAATRRQIMATAFQTRPELQAQLIRQYRALLALGRSSKTKAPTTTPSPASNPTTVSTPAEPAVSTEMQPVVAATHNAPIDDQARAALPKGGSSSDVESQLESLLREIKSGKVETDVSTVVSKLGDALAVESKTSEDRLSTEANWEQLVDSAIEKLEQRREQRLDSDLCEEDEARLRMLYLIADRRDDAVRAITSLEPEMQEFWSKQFFGLATLLNSELISDRSNRLIESKRNLDEAVRRLGESAPLFVRNLAFVTDVQSYGAYTPFDDYEFRPNEPVLLYAEVENYRCKETARGYHTALRSTYEIFDSSRQKVAEHEFSTNEEYCQNVRRDFFTVCEFRIPEKLPAGKFVLRLTVADLNGDKAGESSITFHVRDGS